MAFRMFFAVNTLAPYVLTALIEKPRRLVYLSSLSMIFSESRSPLFGIML
jgi:hypothetical protein